MPSDREGIGPAIYLLAIAGIAYLIVILVQLPGGARRGDFSIYYACAVAMHRGLDPYAINLTDLTRELGLEPDPFQHPADTPTFTLITEPLALMSPERAYAVWMLANAICLGAALYLLFGNIGRRFALLLTLAALGFTPVADNFRWAQSQFAVMLGVLLFFRLMRSGSDGAAGVLLAVLGLLRGYPLVLGGYLVAQRRWRAVGSLTRAFAVGAAATVAIVGIGPCENFLKVLGILGNHRWLSLDPRWEFAPANLSLDAFVARPLMMIFGPDIPGGWQRLARAIELSFQIAILAAAFIAAARAEGERRGRHLALWIATMLILTPVVWLHYLVLLIIPFGMIAVAATQHETRVRVWRFAILSYCIVVLATPLMSTLTFRAGAFDRHTMLLAELGFPALLSAWFAAWRFASEPPSESSGMEDRLKVLADS